LLTTSPHRRFSSATNETCAVSRGRAPQQCGRCDNQQAARGPLPQTGLGAGYLDHVRKENRKQEDHDRGNRQANLVVPESEHATRQREDQSTSPASFPNGPGEHEKGELTTAKLAYGGLALA
jgi:hypothetical protein